MITVVVVTYLTVLIYQAVMQCFWNMKSKILPMIVRATRTCRKLSRNKTN
jgi:hypothetical protein